MTDSLNELIAALRDELQQYGELLALLDQQQELIMARAAGDLFHVVGAVQQQAAVIQAARETRERRQRQTARLAELPEDAPFAEMLERLPSDYQPLIAALVAENNELLTRVQRRVRQNHLLLHRSLELMRDFLGAFFPTQPGGLYSPRGAARAAVAPQQTLYEAVG